MQSSTRGCECDRWLAICNHQQEAGGCECDRWPAICNHQQESYSKQQRMGQIQQTKEDINDLPSNPQPIRKSEVKPAVCVSECMLSA